MRYCTLAVTSLTLLVFSKLLPRNDGDGLLIYLAVHSSLISVCSSLGSGRRQRSGLRLLYLFLLHNALRRWFVLLLLLSRHLWCWVLSGKSFSFEYSSLQSFEISE